MDRFRYLVGAVVLAGSVQMACAGGPDMVPMSQNGIFIGAGGAVDWLQYRETVSSPGTSGFIETPLTINVTPVGQLGFEHYSSSGAMFGIKGLYNYVNKETAVFAPNNPNFFVGSMVAALLEFGYRFDNNVFYLEGGYSALFTKFTSRDFFTLELEGTQTQTLSGGLAGIGYRRFFTPSVFIDAVYSLALYEDTNTFSTTNITPPLRNDSARAQRIFEGDLWFTINYMINF